MIKLIYPNQEYLASYAQAYDEYQHYPRRAGNPLSDPRATDLLAKFERFRKEIDLPQGYVGSTTLWLVDDEKSLFLGQIDIRHRLTERLERYGGHIGYCIRLNERGKGLGTQMLALALPVAKQLGITRCLITCDDDNIGSARVMEKNGFVLGDKLDQVIDGDAITTRRYWKTL